MDERVERVWIIRFKDHGPATVPRVEGKTREQTIREAIEAMKKGNPLLRDLDVIECFEKDTPLGPQIAPDPWRKKRQ